MGESKGNIFFTFSIIVFIVAVFLLIDGLWLYGLVLGIPSLLILTVFIHGMVKDVLAEVTIKKTAGPQNASHTYADKPKNTRVSREDGYENFELSDINAETLHLAETGKFTGKAVVEHGSPFDEYVIAIYSENGTKVGYVPHGNKLLYTYIEQEGGDIPAFGSVIYDQGRLSGEVTVKAGQTSKEAKPE